MARVRAGEAGAVPFLTTHVSVPVLSTLPASSSEDHEEDDTKDAASSGDSATEVEEDSEDDDDLAAAQAENARVRQKEAAMRAEQVARLRQDTARRAARIAALEADGDSTGVSATVSAETTPARRGLTFQSSAARRQPTASTVARQAAIKQLPDAVPSVGPVSVVITPTPSVVGNGRVSAPVVTNVAPAVVQQAVPPRTSTPAESRATVNKPKEFTGDDSAQNEKVDLWVDAMNRFLLLSHVPPHMHLDTARTYLSSTGSASEFVAMKEEEVAAEDKQLTWTYLQKQLIKQYGHRVGDAALETEWAVLKMRKKPSTDGKDDGKSTRTVSTYTHRFLFLLRRLTKHSPQTDDITTIQKYVFGIRDGYEDLYNMMKALCAKPFLTFHFLYDAIEAAEVAEAHLEIVKMGEGNSSSSSSYWANRRRFAGNYRAPAESLNNLQGEGSDEGETDDVEPKKKAQLFGFRFITLPDDGRYKLTEKEQRMLYDEKRCYTCYGQHAVGRGQPQCKKTQKVAPKSLRLK